MKEMSFANVLVVDDELENVRFVGRLLAGRGYQVQVAESGERALEILDASDVAGQPDVILLDILMPGGMDGVETCRRLKSRDDAWSIPVIFLTGRDDNETTLRAFAAGGADFVLKPFDAEVLLARVGAHSQLRRFSRDLESVLAERTRALHEANAELQRLAREICLVEEHEKKRLATELHDSPMQKMALALLQIGSAAKRRDAESDQALEVGLELLRDALQELRTLQFDLSPPVLHQEGLGAALRWLAGQTARRFGLELSFAESGTPLPITPELTVILFQCARELVHNVVKHAGASRGRLEVRWDDGVVRIVVSDDGTGLAPDALRRRADGQGGFGLYSMRERLGLWGGSLAIESDSSGTRATLRVVVEVAASGVPDGVDAASVAGARELQEGGA